MTRLRDRDLVRIGLDAAGRAGFREAARRRGARTADDVAADPNPPSAPAAAFRRGAAILLALRADGRRTTDDPFGALVAAAARVDGWPSPDPWTVLRIAEPVHAQDVEWRERECTLFYHAGDPLSNMHPTRLVRGGVWTSAEALYQAGKFADRPEAREAIRSAPDGLAAKAASKRWAAILGSPPSARHRLGHRLSMARVLALRATQDAAYRAALLATGDAPLVEGAPGEPVDAFWGAIGTGSLRGANVLGRLSMRLRDALRAGDLPYTPA